MISASGLLIGVIVYTHMQPDGPHSMNTYLEDYDWEQHKRRAAEYRTTAPAATEP